jgi:hypothetical protein
VLPPYAVMHGGGCSSSSFVMDWEHALGIDLTVTAWRRQILLKQGNLYALPRHPREWPMLAVATKTCGMAGAAVGSLARRSGHLHCS